jgi:hypothetical protein
MTISVEDFLNISNMALGLGPMGSATYNMLHGLNVQKGMPAITHNTDNQGYVFMTKPGLNLTYDNVMNVTDLSYLADCRENSMGNAIRCMLSPNLFGQAEIKNLYAPIVNGPPGTSPGSISKVLSRSNLIDDKCAFLPITNFLERMSAFPDKVMDVYNSAEGKYGEQITMMDGCTEFNGVFDLTAEFDNMDGDFITASIGTWLDYGFNILKGTLAPFPVFLLNNEMDYCSRIYRLVMDRNRKYVQNIYATGYCFPTTNPDGAKSAYDRNSVFNDENNKVSINFHCVGAEKNRPILMFEFNKTVELFNPDMKVLSAAEANNPNTPMTTTLNMTKVNQNLVNIPFDMKNIFNYNLYPHINTNTYELEWWCYTYYYNTVLQVINNIVSGTMNLGSGSSGLSVSGTEGLINMVLTSVAGMGATPTLAGSTIPTVNKVSGTFANSPIIK